MGEEVGATAVVRKKTKTAMGYLWLLPVEALQILACRYP